MKPTVLGDEVEEVEQSGGNHDNDPMKTCSINGCDRPSKSRQLCTGHYERWRVHGDGFSRELLLDYGAAAELIEKLLVEMPTKCFFWPHTRTTAGYGTIGSFGETRYVHRIICERVHGPAPSPKHHAAHSCGNGHLGCTTPDHLRWATPNENATDRNKHGTDNRGQNHYASSLSDQDVKNIRSLYGGGGITYADIGELFCINYATVGCIVRRENWGHVA